VLARDKKWLANEHADTLLRATKFYHTLQQVFAVTISENFDPTVAPTSVKNLLARTTNVEDFAALRKKYTQTCAQVVDIFWKTIR